jgi:hypothetical protein
MKEQSPFTVTFIIFGCLHQVATCRKIKTINRTKMQGVQSKCLVFWGDSGMSQLIISRSCVVLAI